MITIKQCLVIMSLYLATTSAWVGYEQHIIEETRNMVKHDLRYGQVNQFEDLLVNLTEFYGESKHILEKKDMVPDSFDGHVFGLQKLFTNIKDIDKKMNKDGQNTLEPPGQNTPKQSPVISSEGRTYSNRWRPTGTSSPSKIIRQILAKNVNRDEVDSSVSLKKTNHITAKRKLYLIENPKDTQERNLWTPFTNKFNQTHRENLKESKVHREPETVHLSSNLSPEMSEKSNIASLTQQLFDDIRPVDHDGSYRLEQSDLPARHDYGYGLKHTEETMENMGRAGNTLDRQEHISGSYKVVENMNDWEHNLYKSYENEPAHIHEIEEESEDISDTQEDDRKDISDAQEERTEDVSALLQTRYTANFEPPQSYAELNLAESDNLSREKNIYLSS